MTYLQDGTLTLVLSKLKVLDNSEAGSPATRAKAMNEMYSHLVGDCASHLCDRTRASLIAADAVPILTQAIQDREESPAFVYHGTSILIDIMNKEEHLWFCFFDDIGVDKLLDHMEFHNQTAMLQDVILQVLSWLFRYNLLNAQMAGSSNWDRLFQLVLKATETHSNPDIFQRFCSFLLTCDLQSLPMKNCLENCILQGMADHSDNEDCRRIGWEALERCSGLQRALGMTALYGHMRYSSSGGSISAAAA
jgi:hypothetical protein